MMGRSELAARIAYAIPAIVFAAVIVSQGGLVFAAGALALGLVCIHELFGMYARVRPVRLAAFLALIGLACAASLGGERQVLLALAAFFPVLFLLGVALPAGRGPSLTASMSLTALGVVWIGLGIAFAILLRDLPHGGGLVLAVLLGTFIGDTAAYLGGRLLGSRPLAPTVSPNKTVEGLAIGFVFAVFTVWWYGLGSPDWMGGQRGALLGVAVGLAAPLGDLFESKIKRDAGSKDTGAAFGPHGGVLDRLDAALFALAAGYFVWLAVR